MSWIWSRWNESRIRSDGDAPMIALPLVGDAGELLDARAKAAYRRRLAEID